MNRNQTILKAIQAIALAINGGKGSGNFGHAGRPGKRGGSGSGGLDSLVSKQLSSSFKQRAKAEEEANKLPQESFEWVVQMTIANKAKQSINGIFKHEFDKRGLDMSKVVKDQLEWSEGNGPRDKNTGEYYSMPDLEKNKNTPEHKLHRQFTQDTLRASGIKELTLYRGVRKNEPNPRGYTSFTTSEDIARTFGNRIVAKKVQLKDIVTHYQVQWDSAYISEQEVIVDLH